MNNIYIYIISDFVKYVNEQMVLIKVIQLNPKSCSLI